jgi:hypothetical protein
MLQLLPMPLNGSAVVAQRRFVRRHPLGIILTFQLGD